MFSARTKADPILSLSIYTENHDQARSVSRLGNDSDKWRSLSSKLLAILQVTQSGTQYVYQGQELGVRNAPRSWGVEEYKDVASINYYERVLEDRKKEKGSERDEDVDMGDVLDAFQKKSRDHARLPMQVRSVCFYAPTALLSHAVVRQTARRIHVGGCYPLDESP